VGKNGFFAWKDEIRVENWSFWLEGTGRLGWKNVVFILCDIFGVLLSRCFCELTN
jgi:hypothetical protein